MLYQDGRTVRMFLQAVSLVVHQRSQSSFCGCGLVVCDLAGVDCTHYVQGSEEIAACVMVTVHGLCCVAVNELLG